MENKNMVARAMAPTPKFFKTLRNVGLLLAAVAGTVLTAPVGLPIVVVKIAGYLAVAGGVLSAVSQVTVVDDTTNTSNKNNE